MVGLVLRLWGVGFGLPDLFHPDEPAYVLQALAIARALPDGLTFADPPLFKYVLLVEYAAAYGWQRLAGSVGNPVEFVDHFRADPGPLYLTARSTSAVFGAATALAAGALGVASSGRRVGFIAAWLTAGTYLLVRDAHFGVNDALVTLLVTLGLVPCVRIARGGGRAEYVLAGSVAGLAFAAKYDGIVLLAPLLVAHLARRQGRANRDLAIAFAACALAGIVAFPSLVLETRRVVQDVYLHLYVGATTGYDGLDPDGGYVFYARTLLIGMGWPLLLAALVGLGLSVVTRSRPLLVVGALPVALLAVLGSQHMYFARFALPALPALLVQAAVAFDGVLSMQAAVGVAVALLAAVPTLADAVRFDVLLTRADTRTLASAWIEANVPRGSTLAVDASPLGPGFSADGHRVLVANDWSLFDVPVAEYGAQGVAYLVTSSFTSEVRPIDAARDGRRRAFYAELPQEANVIAEFRPYASPGEPPFAYDQIYAPFNALADFERPGPTVTVYRLDVNAVPGTPP